MSGFNSKRDAAADKLQEHDPCPMCLRGGVCRTPKCGRLALPLDHPFRNAQRAQEQVAWCPDVCPITGLPFFMWIEHHETGQMMPTYGGPYDSYTIPVRDKDGSYCRERYDHDNGWWVTDEVEDVGVQIVSDQAYVSEDEPPQRKPLTDEAVLDIANKYLYNGGKNYGILEFARAIESAHGITEKNT